MPELTLDIQGLVRIRVADPPAALVRQLRRDMSLFLVSSSAAAASASAAFDIVVEPFRSETQPKVLATTQGTVMRFAEVEGSEGRGIGTIDRGRLTTALIPAEPLRVGYDLKRAGPRRIYGLIQQALRLALARRGCALLHAACLNDGRHTILLVGGRGTGKTRIVLGLLREGWNYVADDKVLLADGRARLYEPWIGVRDWHLDACSWVAERLPTPVARAKRPIRRHVRRYIRSLGNRWLGKRLAGPWQERWNPASNVPVEVLFPRTSILSDQRVDAVVHLRPTRDFDIRELAAEPLMRRVAAIQRSAVQDWYPFDELLAAACDTGPALPDAALLVGQLDGAACGELYMTPAVSPERVGHALGEFAARGRPNSADSL